MAYIWQNTSIWVNLLLAFYYLHALKNLEGQDHKYAEETCFLFNLVLFDCYDLPESCSELGRNGNCNPQCNTTACGFDERDCIPAPLSAKLQSIGDGECSHCVTLQTAFMTADIAQVSALRTATFRC